VANICSIGDRNTLLECVLEVENSTLEASTILLQVLLFALFGLCGAH